MVEEVADGCGWCVGEWSGSSWGEAQFGWMWFLDAVEWCGGSGSEVAGGVWRILVARHGVGLEFCMVFGVVWWSGVCYERRKGQSGVGAELMGGWK